MIPCEESAVKKALTRDCFDRGIPRRQRENLSQPSPFVSGVQVKSWSNLSSSPLNPDQREIHRNFI